MSSSVLFSGSSRYASDFEAVIQRAVAISSLPLRQLESNQTRLQAQSAAVQTLQANFASVQSAIESLEAAVGSGLLQATVSNPVAARATLSSGAVAAVHTLAVSSSGSYANSLSKDSGVTKVTNPATGSITDQASFTLTFTSVDDPASSETFTIDSGSTLNSLVEAINDGSNGKVTATVINVGTAASPDYRLSLQAAKLGQATIQLNDGVQDLMTAGAAGERVKYHINGSATEYTSDTRTLALAPGLSIEVLAKNATGESTTITVARDASGISDALAALASAYNSAMDAIDGHRGESGGALTGHGVISTLTGALRNLVNYSTPGSVPSLTALGLLFDSDGRLSLDSTTFSAATDTASELDAALAFLGSEDSGLLMAAIDNLDGLLDSTDGLFQLQTTSLEDQLESVEDLLEAGQSRVDLMEADLRERISAADALIAAMEQQATFMIGLFEQMKLYAKQFG
jgi:flagellar hook-associated protein 2